MEIGTAKTERADRSAPRVTGAREPRALEGIDVKRRAARGGTLQRLSHLDRRRQHLVVQCHRRLDHPSHTGGCLGMTNLRLDGTQRTPRGTVLALLEYFRQGRQLGGIAHFGTGAMRLQQFQGIRRDAGRFVSPLQSQFLASGTRRINGAAAPVAGRAHALEYGINPVAIPLGIVQSLEDQQTDAFAQNGAVGIPVKRLGIAGWRQGRCLRKAHVHEDVVEGIDTSRDHHVREPGRQFKPGQVDRRQGTGARRIHHAVGTADVQPVGNAARRHVAEQTGKRVFLPADVGIRNALHHIFRNVGFHACILERTAPMRMAEPGTERNHQFECAGDTQDDPGSFAVKRPSRVRSGGVTGIDQRALRRHQAE